MTTMVNTISLLDDLYSEGETGSNRSYKQCETTMMTRYEGKVQAGRRH